MDSEAHGSRQHGGAGRTQEMIQLIDSTIQTVRRISSELRPGILDDLGLIPAMEWQCSEFQRRYDVRCRFQHEGSEVFSKDCATVLYRVLQESLTNVARHAHATKVRVNIRNDDRRIHMKIADNGQGIQPGKLDTPRSFGITSMRNRISSLDGTLNVVTERGRGTTISIELPCHGATND